MEIVEGLITMQNSVTREDELIEEKGKVELEVRRGPWTAEEDHLLIQYVKNHGEGRWNSVAIAAGLKRTGKSCRLRWLNYLRPDVRRGNITPQEQLLILHLHSHWGNRWSKIAQFLPGRTDNEIKNYWRTRVQKNAKQLQCHINNNKFKDVMQHIRMPHLISTSNSPFLANENDRRALRKQEELSMSRSNKADVQIIRSPSNSDWFSNSVNSTQDQLGEYSSTANTLNSSNNPAYLQQISNWSVDSTWNLDDILCAQ